MTTKHGYLLLGLVLLCLIGVLVFLTRPSFQTPSPPPPRVYIALGDSVSSGYGLEGYLNAPEGRHSTLFFEMLQEGDYADEYTNMARSGFTTSMLLEKLEGLEDEELALFQNAHLITLNIGGNNILTPFLEYLSDLQLISGLISAWRGFQSPELEAMLEEGVETFAREFHEILTWLETNAPHATVIVNTIYNPIPPEILIVSLPISNWANALIGAMNDQIWAASETRGYFVADLHAHFTDRVELMQFNVNPLEGPLSLDIIHPSTEGHVLIAELHYAVFRENIAQENG